MSFLSKVKFWKKDDLDSDLGFGDDLGKDPFGSSPTDAGSDPFASPPGAGSDPFAGSPDTSTPQDPFATPPAEQAAPPPPGLGGQNQFAAPSQPFSQQSFGPTPSPIPVQTAPSQPDRDNYGPSRDMELISSKLDGIRAALDTVNQRLSNLERMSDNDQFKSRYRW